MTVVFSLLAAGAYAVASVLQQRAAVAVPTEYSMRIGLLTRLLRRPLWLIGVVADLTGFGFEALALSIGSLAVVQPTLMLGLPFALALGAGLSHQHLGRREWTAIVALCGALLLFFLVNRPGGGHAFAPMGRWLVLGLVSTAGCVAFLAAARAVPAWKATFLAAATGVVFSVSAALTKSVATLVGDDLFGTLRHWQLYAMVGVGLLSMLLAQSAFQAGSLRESLPVITLVPPVIGVVVGVWLFGENIHVTVPVVLADALAVALAAWAVVTLGRSSLAESVYAAPPTPAESHAE